MDKINFFELKDQPYISIHIKTQKQLEDLVDKLCKLEYNYGTSLNSDINEIKFMGIRYFGNEAYLSLDRSKKYVKFNYVSLGKDYKDMIIEYSNLDWSL